MMNVGKQIILPAIILLALDFIYLSANKTAFENQVIMVQRVALNVKLWSAVVCYVLLIAGLYYFILRTHRSVLEAFFFGIIVYGVYDSTTYALLKKWDLKLAIMDTLWGGVLMALTTMITYNI
jgi:uncharacterized membrane protein